MTAVADGLTWAPRPLSHRDTPCLARLTAQRPWLETMAVRVGPWDIGLRANSVAAAARVEHLLADRRLPALDGTLPPHFSVELADKVEGRTRGLHLVYRDHEIVARRGDADELMADLDALIEETQASECPDLLALRAAAVVVPDGSVLLLPAYWQATLLPHQARMTKQGFTLRPGRTHLVDSATAELITRSDGGVRLPVRRQVWRVADGEHPIRPAEAVQLGFFATANLHILGPRRTLDGLARLAQVVPALGMPERSAAELIESLPRLG